MKFNLSFLNGSSFLSLDLEPWNTSEAEFKPENIYYELSKPYRLWYEYLRLSPTYWLAHKHITGYKGGLTEDERKKLPLDFDDVIKTYERFRDVYSQTFGSWWSQKGSTIFHAPLRSNKVELISKALHGIPSIDSCIADIENYFGKGELNVNPSTGQSIDPITGISAYKARSELLVVSIPIRVNKSDAMKQLKMIIDDNCYDLLEIPKNSQHTVSSHIYKLHGERFRLKASITGLRLLWTKAQHRNLEPWQIGALAEISKIHKFPNIHIPPKNAIEYQSRITLGSLTNRKLKSAVVVMENAARGKFSCNDEVEIPEINYQYMWQNIRRRMQANEKIFKKTNEYLIKNPNMTAIYGDYDILQKDDI